MRTREIERDYARYGAARRGAVRLPRSASEVLDAALRAYRERLGESLGAALVPALLFVLPFSYLLTFALPAVTTTKAPADVTRQVGEFAVGIVVALGVAVPLVALSLAGFSVFAAENVADWAGLPRPERKGAYALAARILARAILGSLVVLLVGIALLVVAGLALALLGPDSPIPGVFGVIGGVVALFGVLAAMFGLSRRLLAIPAGLFEGLAPREAVVRGRALAGHPPAGRPASRSFAANPNLAMGLTAVETALVYGVLVGALLVVGVIFVLSGFNVPEAVQSVFPTPLVRVVVAEALRVLPAYLVALVLLPYVATVNAMSYLERRVSLEGWDIELMTARLSPRRSEASEARPKAPPRA